ncbi:MAG TPA: ATP-binding cassette domain-containing protein, partial [Paraburkholderia sp.]|nr:ATP-binding cassette domain-containing protein [Paraburkholderia sp.]
EGRMAFGGASLTGMRTFEIARLGIGYVAEHRDVFPTLTVQENLQLGLAPRQRSRAAAFTLSDAYALFPALHARRATRAGVLSGGEQQMLSLARALAGAPDLLIVDEPAEGLAGQVVAQVAACLGMLRERGVAVLLIEQRLTIAHEIASRIAVMGHGEIVFDASFSAFQARDDVMREWLGIG